MKMLWYVPYIPYPSICNRICPSVYCPYPSVCIERCGHICTAVVGERAGTRALRGNSWRPPRRMLWCATLSCHCYVVGSWKADCIETGHHCNYRNCNCRQANSTHHTHIDPLSLYIYIIHIIYITTIHTHVPQENVHGQSDEGDGAPCFCIPLLLKKWFIYIYSERGLLKGGTEYQLLKGQYCTRSRRV